MRYPVHVLRVLKGHVTRRELISVYNAFVRSVLEYASPLFLGISIDFYVGGSAETSASNRYRTEDLQQQ